MDTRAGRFHDPPGVFSGCRGFRLTVFSTLMCTTAEMTRFTMAALALEARFNAAMSSLTSATNGAASTMTASSASETGRKNLLTFGRIIEFS